MFTSALLTFSFEKLEPLGVFESLNWSPSSSWGAAAQGTESLRGFTICSEPVLKPQVFSELQALPDTLMHVLFRCDGREASRKENL